MATLTCFAIVVVHRCGCLLCGASSTCAGPTPAAVQRPELQSQAVQLQAVQEGRAVLLQAVRAWRDV